MPGPPRFLFATCQVGAETALVDEAARRWPGMTPAYRRPGFVTFKMPPDLQWTAAWDLDAVFARACGLSLGKAQGRGADELARAAWELVGQRPWHRIHVWERDRRGARDDEPEPFHTTAAGAAREALVRQCPAPDARAVQAADPESPATFGDLVVDCVVVEPDEWWIGYHRARSCLSRWPGGVIPLELPAHAASRAWLKMEEALRWSGLPIPRGARVAEIGSAPGGASQALLDRDLWVTGIDPAKMHEAVLAHPHFTHVRRRSTQVPRKTFRKVRWLTADMNVAPSYTLDAVEAIVTHPEVSIRGMLLTLKLTDWKLAGGVPAWLDRVRSWGFNQVHARQLRHHRREICVAALQKPFRRKAFRPK